MTQHNKDVKEYVRMRDMGICQKCGKYNWQGHTAHLIAETKVNIKIHGKDIIDHAYNKRWVCCLECNDSFNIGNKIKRADKLAELIKSHGKEHFTVNEINEFIEIGDKI